ncbi:MAG TPA: sigma-G-dependent sporulation-specific acid-soluble spore protein CsgA [Chondromyces sp.]|nr:sigma-G-dependent sporulation-specific acid-soluble spore protein CsgA [Chondromyces sp.]
MDQTLSYLREVLSNYTDRSDKAQSIHKKLMKNSFKSEGEFVRALTQEESMFLDGILPDEINHANEVQDEKRAHELNEVYELLF